MSAFSFSRPKYLVGNKPFNRLPLKQRAIFVLWLAGFTYRDIEALGMASRKTITNAIRKGYEEYGHQK